MPEASKCAWIIARAVSSVIAGLFAAEEDPPRARAQPGVGLGGVGQHRVDARRAAGARRDAVRAAAPAEQGERARLGAEGSHAGAVAGEQRPDAVGVGIARRAE